MIKEDVSARFVSADDTSVLDLAIWNEVRDAFCEALGLDDDEVDLHNTVIEDLGAESLDFLDIAFRLERAFDIKIPRGGVESTARGGIDDDEYEVDGVLTKKALLQLSEGMPEVPSGSFREGLKVNEVPELFRVATFYNLVLRLLSEK